MPLPKAKRVIYNKNPLAQVICQLRFPAILKIQKDIPADFQDCIRAEFPRFRETEETIMPIGKEQKSGLPGELLRQMLPTPTKNYEFLSEDGIWKVNLTRTFVALSTSDYKRREEFQKRLDGPLQGLISVYKPAYFSRIGLRYVDILRRSAVGLEDVPWTELLQPHILGLLSSEDVHDEIQTLETKYEVLLDDHKGIARIVTGLVEEGDPKKQCFKIDTDFFSTDRTDTSDVMAKLDDFHTFASRLIQWLIKKKLHDAMEPEEL